MKKIITRDVPYMYAISADELNVSDVFELERILNVKPNNFVLVKHRKDCIILNKDLKNLNEIEETIKKIMASKYLPEKLFDKFQALTDEKSTEVLVRYYSDWRNQIRERELHKQALKILRATKGLRISWKIKRNKELIKELFDIGFGIYDDEATCNYQQGAENAFIYGYLLGIQSKQ